MSIYTIEERLERLENDLSECLEYVKGMQQMEENEMSRQMYSLKEKIKKLKERIKVLEKSET